MLEGHPRPQQGALRFGEQVRRYRIDAGLTQQELAERAGLSVRGISDLERGQRQGPYPDTVRRLAEALGLGVAERQELLASSRRRADARTPLAEPSPVGLPVALTSFVGRERDRAAVQPLLETARLVTLTGTGGIGKTRLALQVARAHADLAFVDLAPLADGGLVPAAVAAALGVREQPTVPPQELVSSFLAARALLLVLDNCEHLVAACAEFADALLRVCPGVRILATSREPLGVAGEQLWPVPPLALSGRTESDPTTSEAVQLFAERARLSQPDFALDARNGPVVAEVCRRLDGIPLAIELAAARLPALGVEQLAARLDDRFRVLSVGSRLAPPRQQTLRAVVNWSYELLSDPERKLFRRLAVFAGGWTLEMTEQICGGGGLGAEEILDLLARLVQKSLVVVSQEAGETRYGFLETLRQYAAERLREAAEDGLVRAQHLQWCLALVERADADKDGPRRAAWLACLEREHGNLRAALDWSLADSGTFEMALRLAGALGWFWWLHGHAREGSRRMGEVLERTVADPATDPGAGWVARARAWALAEAGRLHLRMRDLAYARQLLEQALSLAQRVRCREAEAGARLYLGELALEDGDSTAARAHLVEGLALAREQPGQGPAPSRFLHWLGHAAEADAQPCEAASFYAQARELAAAHGDAFFEAVAVRGLASTAIERGDLASAHALLLDTVALSRRVQNATVDYPTVLGYFARLAAAEDQPERALRLAGAAAALRQAAGTHPFRHDQELLERRLDQVRRVLSAEAAAAASVEGQAMALEDALAYAVAPGARPVLGP